MFLVEVLMVNGCVVEWECGSLMEAIALAERLYKFGQSQAVTCCGGKTSVPAGVKPMVRNGITGELCVHVGVPGQGWRAAG